MKHLPTGLWKEWREQRAALAILAALLAAGAAPLAWLLEAPRQRDPLLAAAVVAAAVAATLVSVGSDLLARERQRGTLAFLERAPAGLGGAFRAKLAFLALALVAAVAFGALLASAVSLVGTGELPDAALGDGPVLLAAVALVLSLWVFAVSAWTPSGATALPTALLLLPALAWPVALVLRDVPWLRPSAQETVLFLALVGGGAITSAWASFVAGSRRGGTRRKAAVLGLAVAALAFLPSWLWVGARWHEARHAPFRIHHGWITADAERAYLNLLRSAAASDSVYADPRSTALVVELASGAWRHAGAVDGSAFTEALATARQRSLVDGPLARLNLLDGHATEPKRIALGDPAPDAIPSRSAGGEPELGPTDFDLPADLSAYTIRHAGLGHAIAFSRDGARAEIYRDPARDLVVDLAAVRPDRGAVPYVDVRVRPGRWLVRAPRGWRLVDPTTRDEREVSGLRPRERVGPSLTDGRVLVLGADAPALLDPEHGARTPLAVHGAEPDEVMHVSRGLARGPWEAPIDAETATAVLVRTRRWSAPAVLDVRAGTLRLARPAERLRVHLIAVDGLVAFAVEDGLELVRYDLAAGTRAVLFRVDAVER